MLGKFYKPREADYIPWKRCFNGHPMSLSVTHEDLEDLVSEGAWQYTKMYYPICAWVCERRYYLNHVNFELHFRPVGVHGDGQF
jgi:hypothetical protein